MKVRKICFVLAVLMLASAFAASCGQSAAEPAVSPAAAVETTPSPEPTAQAEEEKKGVQWRLQSQGQCERR